jgi:hypothetical protein
MVRISCKIKLVRPLISFVLHGDCIILVNLTLSIVDSSAKRHRRRASNGLACVSILLLYIWWFDCIGWCMTTQPRRGDKGSSISGLIESKSRLEWVLCENFSFFEGSHSSWRYLAWCWSLINGYTGKVGGYYILLPVLDLSLYSAPPIKALSWR